MKTGKQFIYPCDSEKYHYCGEKVNETGQSQGVAPTLIKHESG
jgi:hypothetical protein